MKILHSSDWHIGSTLYGKKRYAEYSRFLAWLIDFIQDNSIDVLLVSGDIFDTALPSNTAQNLYYTFLINLQKTSCKHIIITGGNHDSPSFLDAPGELLKSFNIHVLGAMPEHREYEIINIEQNDEQLIVLAVPYLRERDLQYTNITDDYETRAQKIVHGIKKHYHEMTELALQQKNKDKSLLLAMGHFYVAGSAINNLTDDNDGERELYIGSLVRISADIFPKELDYIAMGHIHSAQKIAQNEHIRYCGSPLAMSFGEKAVDKKIIVLDTQKLTNDRKFSIAEYPVPEFQITRKICGDKEKINQEMEKLKKLNQSVWLEVEYRGEEFSGTETNQLKEYLAALTKDTQIEILKFKNQNIIHNILDHQLQGKKLEELTPLQIFQNLLKGNNFSEEKQNDMLACYQEILTQINEHDVNE